MHNLRVLKDGQTQNLFFLGSLFVLERSSAHVTWFIRVCYRQI
jgi:hypothetical protein